MCAGDPAGQLGGGAHCQCGAARAHHGGHTVDPGQGEAQPCGAARSAEEIILIFNSAAHQINPQSRVATVQQRSHALLAACLQLQVPNQPDAYEFSIRTPVTPPRWKDFDIELEAAWEAVVTQLMAGAHRVGRPHDPPGQLSPCTCLIIRAFFSMRKHHAHSMLHAGTMHAILQPLPCTGVDGALLHAQSTHPDTVDYPKLAQSILRYGYYWYNFMPLARGTAATGYTTILSLFWAAGMPVTARIPKEYQVGEKLEFSMRRAPVVSPFLHDRAAESPTPVDIVKAIECREPHT